MTRKKIEEKAVIAVKSAISEVDLLDDYINENDKTQLLDGSIYIYLDESCKKSSIYSIIPVQVKGTTTINDLSLDTVSFGVEVDDLKGFEKIGGVFFFVVAIRGSKTKIYYNALTRVSLASILKNCTESQAKKNIQMRAFPRDAASIYSVVATFQNNLKRQSSFLPEDMITLEEANHSTEIVKITSYVKRMPNSTVDDVDLFLLNDFYLYADLKNGKIPVPILADPSNFHVVEPIECPVTVRGELYYSTVLRVKENDGIKIIIGDCLSLYLSETENDLPKITFTPSHKLTRQIQDYEFIVAALNNKGIEINGSSLGFNIGETEHKLLEEYTRTLATAKRVKQLLTELNVTKELDTSLITDRDKQWLPILLKGILDKKEVVLTNDNLPHYGLFPIGNINLILALSKVDEKENKYKIYDFFHSNLVFAFDVPNSEEKVRAPVYCALKYDEFAKIDNIDYTDIIESVKKIYEKETHDIDEWLTVLLLTILKSYDNIGLPEQLQAAEDLCLFTDETYPSDSPIALLNRLQIVKRRRMLADDEKTLLYEVVEKQEVSLDCKIGAYILLDNKEAALFYLNKLTPLDKQTFMDYPIYNLLAK